MKASGSAGIMAIDNIAGRLLPDCDGEFGVAGLRVAAVVPYRTHHLVHVPTGAGMVIAHRARFPSAQEVVARRGAPLPWGPGRDVPLSAYEEKVLAIAGSLSVPMQKLLAGLMVRINTHDPAGRWTLAYWSTRRGPIASTELCLISGRQCRRARLDSNGCPRCWSCRPHGVRPATVGHRDGPHASG